MPARVLLTALILVVAAHGQPPPPRVVRVENPARMSGPPIPREFRTDGNGYPLPPGAVARLGVPPALSGFARFLAWTSDGRQIIAADWSTVTLLDAATGQWVETQNLGDRGGSLSAPPPQNGRRLVRLNGNAGSLYDTASAADVWSFRLPKTFLISERRQYSLGTTSDLQFLAGISAAPGQAGVAWRYDLARDRFGRVIDDRADLQSVRLSPDGRRAFATGGTREPELTARDIESGKELWTVRLKEVGTLRLASADGRRLAVTDSSGISVFDADNGKRLLSAPLETNTPPGLWGIDLAPDGDHLALADYRQVIVWNIRTGQIAHRLPHAARLVAFSPDGKSLLTASAWVQRWDIRTGKPAYAVPLLDRPVGASLLRWSGDGKRLLTVWPGDRKGDEADRRPELLAVWDVNRRTSVWRQTNPPAVLAATLDRTGATVRACTADHKLRTWPVDAPGATQSWPVVEPIGVSGRQFFAFLPNGQLAVQTHSVSQADLHLYGPTDRVVHVPPYRWPAGTMKQALHGAALGATVVRPTGSRWDLLNGRAQPPLLGGGGQTTTLSPDVPETFVVGQFQSRRESTVNIWDATTGRMITEMPVWVMDVARMTLAVDGRLAAIPHDADVSVYDLRNPKWAHPLPAGPTSALAFSPDGRFLASAQTDGTVLIWDVPRARDPWTADPDVIWAELASADAAVAWRALWQLLDHPDRALPLLKDRLRPVPSHADTPDLIARLDHAKYTVREEAMRRLADRGEPIEIDLQEALRKSTSAEQRDRLEDLMAKLDPAVPPARETLRGLRAVWLLERIGTADAQRLLTAMAGGSSGSRVTAAAKAALTR